jgi:hypothetical protein
MIEFVPTDSFVLRSRNWLVQTGPAPIDSVDPRGQDWVGQTWLCAGREQKIVAVESYCLPTPIRKGAAIGIVFEGD